ncbi:MAG TPA: hypothetical protein VGF45_09970, partial [Polyangia bacterium]
MLSEAPQRYLWTDAFAVCNLLSLARATHDEPYDSRLEWERDGQYFHYLTKWMHALDQVARWTQTEIFNRWARELAEAAFRIFSYGPANARGMFWKMGVDGKFALVPSMGQHDPLDGLVTFAELDLTETLCFATQGPPRLGPLLPDLAGMLTPATWVTPDLLGLGGLLVDAARVAQLMEYGRFADGLLLEALLVAAHEGIRRSTVAAPHLTIPASQRLAFRELGLAIGLAALPFVEGSAAVAHATDRSGITERLKGL